MLTVLIIKVPSLKKLAMLESEIFYYNWESDETMLNWLETYRKIGECVSIRVLMIISFSNSPKKTRKWATNKVNN